MSKGFVERVIALKETHPDACVVGSVMIGDASVSGFLGDMYDFGRRAEFLDKGGGVFVWVKLPRGKTLRLHLTEEPDDE